MIKLCFLDNKEKQEAMDFKKFAADAGTFLNRAKQVRETSHVVNAIQLLFISKQTKFF